MRAAVFIALLFFALSSQAAEVVQVTWATTHGAEPATFSPPASNLLPAFRIAIQRLPESATVVMALSQPSLLGLTAGEAGELQPLMAERYQLLAESPLYARVGSALPYCFSEKKPGYGQASVYVPDGAGADTPVILFLHGYAGSFLWYQHYLSDVFPKYIIICPAYGITTINIPQAYVAEAMTAVSKRLGFALSTPCLIGLSAGGFGACRLYTVAPQFYGRMICLAAYPPDETIALFTRDSRLRFLSGAREPFVTSGEYDRRIGQIRRLCPNVEAATITDADHFFLLSHAKEAQEYLRRWVLQQ